MRVLFAALIASALISACDGGEEATDGDPDAALGTEAPGSAAAGADIDAMRSLGDAPSAIAVDDIGAEPDDGNALEFLRAAGESTAQRPARGMVTFAGTYSDQTRAPWDDSSEWNLEEDSAVLEFESDGEGGLSLKFESDLLVKDASVTDGKHESTTEWKGYDGYDGLMWGGDDGVRFYTFVRAIEVRSVEGQGYVGFPVEMANGLTENDTDGFEGQAYATISESIGLVGLCHPLIGMSAKGESCNPQTVVHRLTQMAENVSIGESSITNGVEAVHVSFQVPMSSIGNDFLGDNFSVNAQDSGLLTVEVWIDGEGLIRRMQVDLTQALMRSGLADMMIESASEGETPVLNPVFEMTAVTDFHDFDMDTPIIEAPPADSVVGHSDKLSDGLDLDSGNLDFGLDSDSSDIFDFQVWPDKSDIFYDSGIEINDFNIGGFLTVSEADGASKPTFYELNYSRVEPPRRFSFSTSSGTGQNDCADILTDVEIVSRRNDVLRNDSDALAFLKAAGEAVATLPVKGTIASCNQAGTTPAVDFKADGSGSIRVTIGDECDAYYLCTLLLYGSLIPITESEIELTDKLGEIMQTMSEDESFLQWATAAGYGSGADALKMLEENESVAEAVKRMEEGELMVELLEKLVEKYPRDPYVELPWGTLVEIRSVDGQGYRGFPSALIRQSDLRPSGDMAWMQAVRPIGLCAPLSIIPYRNESCDPQGGVHMLTRLARVASFGEAGDVSGSDATHVIFEVAMRDLARDIYGDAMYEASLQQIEEDSRASGTANILDMVFHAEAWIDSGGLVRRMIVDETPMARAIALLASKMFIRDSATFIGDSATGEDWSTPENAADLILKPSLRQEQSITEAMSLIESYSITDFSDFDTSIASIEAPSSELIVDNPEYLEFEN